ncbi:MAG TPA: hypothetical protein VF041_08025 [Gemmatimonadaceae bacterium]
MAQIRIEPKRTGLGWLWVLIALVVIALAAWLFIGRGGTSTRSAPRAAGPAPTSYPVSRQTVMPLAAT